MAANGAGQPAPPLRGVYLRPLPDTLVPARHSAGARVRAAQLQAFLRPLQALAAERLPLHGSVTLSVLGSDDWRRVCRYPYGFAFTRTRPTAASRAGASGPSADVIVPADHPGRLLRRFDEVLLRAARAGVRPPRPGGAPAAGTNLPAHAVPAHAVPAHAAPASDAVPAHAVAASDAGFDAEPLTPADRLPATDAGPPSRAPAALEAPAPSGDVRELLDLIVGHEWGHAVASLAGLRLRVGWLDELLATVIYLAALRSTGGEALAARMLAWAAVQAAGGDDSRRDLGAFEYPRGRLRLAQSMYFQGVFTRRAWELVAGGQREPWSFVLALHAAVAPVARARDHHRGDVARALMEVEPSFRDWFASFGSDAEAR